MSLSLGIAVLVFLSMGPSQRREEAYNARPFVRMLGQRKSGMTTSIPQVGAISWSIARHLTGV